VDVRRLADDAHDLGARVQQFAEHPALLRALARLARHPERGQRGVLQRLLRGEPEELRVAGVRARPPALDERHAELVDLVEDPQTVLDRVRQAGLLRAVAERGVVQLDLPALDGRHAVARSTTRSPTSGVAYPISPARIDAIFVHAKRMPSDTRAAAPSSPSCASNICTAPIAASGLMVAFPM
jgi:hypothetical protein